MSIQLRDGLHNQSVDRILEDILVRFVVNVPKEDLSSLERVFFQVEEGQWFYTDFVRLLNPTLPPMKMKSFAPRILSKCPLVWKWGNPSEALSQFGKYKSTIPVRGIALMNKDLTKLLLVRGSESGTWSFPRGKISKDESDIECAIREVREETSFDARNYLNELDVLERTVGGKNFRIYLARGVPEDFNFEPLVRGEIADIKWFNIKTLRKAVRTNHNKFFVVNAMMEPLNSWVNKQKGYKNDEALMREVEIKLKQLMGITSPEPETVNDDAGRELLNILQGSKLLDVSPVSNGNWNGPVSVPMTLPQHLQDIYAGVKQTPQFFPPFYQNSSNMPPAHFPVPNFNGTHPHALQHGLSPQQPSSVLYGTPFSGESSSAHEMDSSMSQKPHLASTVPNSVLPVPVGPKPSLANSKELLSILKGKTTVKNILKSTDGDETIKRLDSPVSNSSEMFRNKKITLLKRNKGSNENESATLLSILGKKPPSPESPKSQCTEPDAVSSEPPSFLSVLNLGRKSSDQTQARLLPSADLFPQSMLVPTKTPVPVLIPVQEPPSAPSPSQAHNTGNFPPDCPKSNQNLHTPTVFEKDPVSESISAPAQFLSILKKGSVSLPSGVPPDKTNGKTNDNKGDIEVQRERLQELPVLDLSAGNQILSMLNRNTDKPTSQPFSTPPVKTDFSQFEDFDNFENFDDFDEISESQKDIYNSIANNFDVATDEDDYFEDAQFELPKSHRPPIAHPPVTHSQAPQTLTNSAGAGLLLLLQGGKPASRGPLLSLQDTYGVDSLAPQQVEKQNFFKENCNSNTNGAQILRLLKREKQ